MDMLVENLRSNFKSGITKSREYRIKQLNNLMKMYEEGENDLVAALKEDLGKPSAEALMFEIDFNKNFIIQAIASLDAWGADEYVEKNVITLMDTTYIHREPLGVCLVMGAWNYPVQLTLQPVTGAIAAGNCVVIKPSEVSSSTALVIEKLITKYMDPATVQVVNGGIPETTALLKEKFDHIFFTGGTMVGRIVAQAASKHLTPCTLELGGKCPLFLDDSVDLSLAAKRIVWGKMINLGQTCVAPDYVLCNSAVMQKLVAKINQTTQEFFGPMEGREKNPDLCRIINDRHYKRLVNVIANTKGNIVQSGNCIEEERFIDLHVITNVSGDDPAMQEEIFGPILPIVLVESVNEAIDFIKSKPKPLSLYIFSEKKAKVKQIIEETSSGSVCVNDVIIQLTVDTLPFGGVEDSGYGAYHGKYTYDTFSHKKSVLIRDFGMIGEKLGDCRYPPYTRGNVATFRMLMKLSHLPAPPGWLKYALVFGLGIGSVVALKFMSKKFGKDLPDWL